MEESVSEVDEKNSKRRAAGKARPSSRWRKGFTRRGLYRRGWTDAAVEAFLGSPDWTIPNPYYRGVVPTRIWERYRVERIEQTDEWERWRRAELCDQESLNEPEAANNDSTIQIVESVQIQLPDLDREELTRQAIEVYNRHQERQGRDQGLDVEQRRRVGTTRATANDDAEFLERITVNHLRHNETSYDAVLKQLRGKTGETAAKYRLRYRIYFAIAEKYPWLAEEAKRQLREREPAVSGRG